MIRLIGKATRTGYQRIAKPVLFSRKPDSVHKELVRTAKFVQKLPGIRALPGLWAYQNSAVLSQTVFGLKFRNPVGLSAGFDKKIDMPRIMKAVGFGFMTGGSVTYGEAPGNKGDWFYRLPKSQSLVVNAGLPSEGTPVVSERVAKYPHTVFSRFPLVVSVAKTNSKEAAGDEMAIRDYAASLAVFDDVRNVAMLEINISCPNTYGGEPFTTPGRLDVLLDAVDALALVKPVVIKMPISVPLVTFRSLLDIIAKHNIAGVTIGNLMKDRKKAKLKDDLPQVVKGNLSGAPNRELTTKLVREAYERHGDKLVVIGVGGIFSAEDAYEKICAGATLVELITGMIFEGPQLIGEINSELVKLVRADGYAHISEAIGKHTERGKMQ